MSYEDTMSYEQREGKESKEKAEKITMLGSKLHDAWRKPRWREESRDYEPRPRKTIDETWSRVHEGSATVDIANTPYENLPSDWQKENKASAEVAIEQVEKAVEAGISLDASFIEDASSALHDEWRKRRMAEGYDENDKET